MGGMVWVGFYHFDVVPQVCFLTTSGEKCITRLMIWYQAVLEKI